MGGLNNSSGYVFFGSSGYPLYASAKLTNCSVTGNTVSGDKPLTGGGGLFNGDGAVSLVACTVSGNTANVGAGVHNYFSSLFNSAKITLPDTIVAGDATPGGQPNEIGGTDPGEVTGTYDLIGTGGSGGVSSAPADHNDLNVANPGLAPLGDYGGPTETMALLPGSPAIHHGTAVSGVTTDQRGFPLDNPPDIGAFQSQAGPRVVDTAIDGLGSSPGELSLRQAVNLANVLTGGATITFDRSAFDRPTAITLTAGPLELSNTTGPVTILGPGLDSLAVSGGGASRVFQVDPNVTASLSGLTITGGVTTGNGGGLLNQGKVTLADVAVVGNMAADGGGVANLGTAVILGSSIDANAASADGGGVDNTGSLSLTQSDLSAKSAGTDGGGLFNSGTAALAFDTVDGDSATAGGGVDADPSGSPVVLIGTSLTHNKGGNTFGRVISL